MTKSAARASLAHANSLAIAQDGSLFDRLPSLSSRFALLFSRGPHLFPLIHIHLGQLARD
jgi:hypothetical protein